MDEFQVFQRFTELTRGKTGMKIAGIVLFAIGGVNGIYLTLEQCAYVIPLTQGALFAFK